MATVGFIGLGNMGWPMAANLVAAGHDVVVHDADPARAEAFASEKGARVAGGPSGVAGADALITMLPDDRVVASVLLDDGFAAALPAGAVIVDMSSSDPVGTRRLGERLPADALLVDAPVSGGVPRAQDGTLSIMVGGSDDAVARAMPLLEALGERIFRTGELGTGHAMKALNNYLAAAAYSAATEALAIGRRFGLDPETMFDIVNTSTGRSFSSEVVLRNNVVTGEYATGFALGLLAKDVGIAAGLAQALDVDAPTLDLVSRRWAEAAVALGPDADHSEAHKQWWPADADRFATVERA
ncbi:MAG: NAD(P)-dependent oxidoreductase [Solirubrobacteraceae bacterium]|nr:NAD(P)-dependent oxidoreductase [Solirubrobacteraceae bacterium]